MSACFLHRQASVTPPGSVWSISAHLHTHTQCVYWPSWGEPRRPSSTTFVWPSYSQPKTARSSSPPRRSCCRATASYFVFTPFTTGFITHTDVLWVFRCNYLVVYLWSLFIAIMSFYMVFVLCPIARLFFRVTFFFFFRLNEINPLKSQLNIQFKNIFKHIFQLWIIQFLVWK